MKNPRKHDDWEAYEHAREVNSDIHKRLLVGAQKAGVKLNADECLKVLLCWKPMPKPSHRKPVVNVKTAIKLYCLMLQRGANKLSPSDAVAKTAAHFETSKWVVRKALREVDVD